MTPDVIARAEAVVAAVAVAEPWTQRDGPGRIEVCEGDTLVAVAWHEGIGALIAAAPDLLRALVEELRSQRADNAKLQAELKSANAHGGIDAGAVSRLLADNARLQRELDTEKAQCSEYVREQIEKTGAALGDVARLQAELEEWKRVHGPMSHSIVGYTLALGAYRQVEFGQDAHERKVLDDATRALEDAALDCAARMKFTSVA